MLQKELAKILGISPAMVSKLKKLGMPVDDPDRSRRWRKRNLEPGRIKGSRFDPNRGAQIVAAPHATPSTATADLQAELLPEVEAAGAAIDQALATENGEWAALMVAQVRDLLRKIFDDAQPRLSLQVWLALVEWFIHPDCAIGKAPDKETLLTPAEFAMRWHGWEIAHDLNAYALDQARDWDDRSINGWPECPDDDATMAET